MPHHNMLFCTLELILCLDIINRALDFSCVQFLKLKFSCVNIACFFLIAWKKLNAILYVVIFNLFISIINFLALSTILNITHLVFLIQGFARSLSWNFTLICIHPIFTYTVGNILKTNFVCWIVKWIINTNFILP